MALVNPQIAMSYRPTTEYQPRNALAEYAQIQNIIGGQRQAEVAEMQLDQLRQDRDALRQIQAAIVEKGGPPDLGAAADAMIRSGRPQYIQQGLTIRDTLRKQKLLENYEREYYPTDAATPSAVPAAVATEPAAAAATEPPIPRGLTSTGSQIFDNMIADEALQNRPAPLVQGPITAEEIAAARARNAAPAATAPAAVAPAAVAPAAVPAATNALAPAAVPATTNAMRAAAQPDVDTLMRRYNQAARAGSPDAPAILKQIEAALRGDQNRLVTVSQGQTAIDPRTGAVIFTAPAAPTAPRIDVIGVAKDTNKTVYFDKDTRQQFTIGVDASGKQVQVPYTGAVNRSTSSVTVQGAPQERAFETALGKGQAERILQNQIAARDAVSIIDTVNTGRQILRGGMITGAGAEFLVNLNQALKTVGIDAGYADAAANSQAFAANMANNVGRLIKQFGAGTGLSNADREYAEKMAGSKITLDDKAINRILDINERVARNVIKAHNKEAQGIRTNIPLTVEEPPARTPEAPATPPQEAIDLLRANPNMRGAFDAKYGAGAAARVLGVNK